MNRLIYFMNCILLIFLNSCKLIDDTDKICTTNCTTVTGKIKQANGVGIPNVEVIFSYVSFAGGKFERKIARTKTDRQGNYTLTGYIEDREVRESSSFQIFVNDEDINKLAEDNFIKPSDLFDIAYFNTNTTYFNINKRDTTIEVIDFTLPYKTNITINLNNFNPTSQYDTFGFANEIIYGFGTSLARSSKYSTDKENKTFNSTASLGRNIITVNSLTNAEDYNTVIDTVIINSLNDEIILNYNY